MPTHRTILLLTDFLKTAERAADLALELALNNNADLLLYNSIVAAAPDMADGRESKRRLAGEDIKEKTSNSINHLNKVAERLKSKMSLQQQAAVKINVQEGMGSVTETILTLVAENEIWMIVMGSHVQKGMANTDAHNNISSVLNNCGCPLLLVP